MSDRRARGLRYWCDEKFTPEHYQQHKKTQLFSMEVEEEDVFEDVVEQEVEHDTAAKIQPRISLNAVNGISDYNTMRVRGTFGKRTLFVLLDSGSTHNFLDPKVAAKLGCAIKPSGLTKVTVADCRKLGVQGKIDGFKWNFQTTEFETDIMLIPLQGCDMVLGIQWLASLGPISWEFKKLEMGFLWKNQKVLLNGIKTGSVRDIKAQKLNKLQDDQVQLAMICVKEVTKEEVVERSVLQVMQVENKELPEVH